MLFSYDTHNIWDIDISSHLYRTNRFYSTSSACSKPFPSCLSKKYSDLPSYCDHKCKPTPIAMAHLLIASDTASFNLAPSVLQLVGFSTSPASSTVTIFPSISTVKASTQPVMIDLIAVFVFDIFSYNFFYLL